MNADHLPYTPFEEYPEEGHSFNVKEKLAKLLFHWPLFVLSVAGCLFLAYLHLRSAVPVYTVKAKLLIKNGATTETALSERELFKSTKMIANELEILKSLTLMKQVVSDLQLWVNYEQVGEYKTQDLYATTPVRFGLLVPGGALAGQTIEIRILDSLSFQLRQPNSSVRVPFSRTVKNQYGTWKLEPTGFLEQYVGQTIRIRLNDPDGVAHQYMNSVSANLTIDESTVVDLTIRDQVPQRAEDVLNRLIVVYNLAAVADRNKVSESSLRFIEDRLASITGELNAVEKDVEGYKSSRGLTDISSKSQIFLDNVKTNDAKLNEVQLQLQVISEIEKYISTDHPGLAPATVGITDPVLLGLINRLMALQAQKDKMLATTPETNPIFEPIDRQISSTKTSIAENIRGIKNSLRVTQGQLNRFNSSFKASIREIPGQEREFISIKRQQSIKEDLYIYLLQKREEAAVSYASTVSGSRVVDPAYYVAQQSVNKPYTYAMAFILGLILPAGLIFARDLMNNRVMSAKDIQETVPAPILGEVSFRHGDNPLVVMETAGRIIGEQFRTLRTNLRYVHGRKPGGKITLLTSGMSGDGKSFVASNLGLALASAGRRTVILELDFRKPAIMKTFGMENQAAGLSSYLIGSAPLQEIIRDTGKDPNLKVIGAGPVPPNPSELLEQPEMEELLTWLRTAFDEILIDSPPVLLVTDALILSRFCDAVLYVVRQNHTYKTQLTRLRQLHREQKLERLNIIFNGVERQENQYGYAYYQAEEKKPLRQTIRGFLKRF